MVSRKVGVRTREALLQGGRLRQQLLDGADRDTAHLGSILHQGSMYFNPYSVNFIAASHAVDWYFGGTDKPSFLHSTELLLRYHLGSVVGGSLLQGFFSFIDLILDFLFVFFT